MDRNLKKNREFKRKRNKKIRIKVNGIQFSYVNKSSLYKDFSDFVQKFFFFSDDKIYNVCRKNIEFQNIKETIEKLLKYNQQQVKIIEKTNF